ncbi:hypothetical protein PAEPH01_0317 [Pancytospora epiphaga]|nr:hypothetical protein PAEPH01_0317 [Pancytospora epiphaga]
MTWDGVVMNYHKQYSREIGLASSVEAYIQTIMLKKTLESISFKYRSINNGDAEAITVRLDAGEGPGEPLKLLPETTKGI